MQQQTAAAQQPLVRVKPNNKSNRSRRWQRQLQLQQQHYGLPGTSARMRRVLSRHASGPRMRGRSLGGRR
jgi:hypothetical protein